MKRTLAVAGMILCVAGSVLAQEAGPKEALAKLFIGQLDSVKLTDAFSRALPREKLSEVISSIEAQLGASRRAGLCHHLSRHRPHVACFAFRSR